MPFQAAPHDMLFRRKRKKKDLEESQEASRRRLYRAPVDPQVVRATIAREGQEAVRAGLVDLSLEGAGIAVPLHLDPEFATDEVVDLELRHQTDGWVIETPARIECRRAGGGVDIVYGVHFLSPGSLYAQLENTLGRYFNRRRHHRVRPDLDADIAVRLRQGGQRPRGVAHDLSKSGMCVALDLVAATAVTVDEPLEVSFQLPGSAAVHEGPARVVAKRRLALREFVSLDFDLEAEGGIVEHFTDLVRFVERRAAQMEAFSADLRAGRG